MFKTYDYVAPGEYARSGFGREYILRQLLEPFEDDSACLNAMRKELLSSDPNTVGSLIGSIAISPWLSQAVLDARSLEVCSDQAFENVLQIHNWNLARQSELFRPQFEAYAAEFSSIVDQLVYDGVLPASVIEAMLNIRNIEFAVANEVEVDNVVGICARSVSGTNFDVVVSPSVVQDGILCRATVFHELIHGISHQANSCLRKLLVETLWDGRMARDMTLELEEALTEHLTQVILGDRDMEGVELEHNPEVYAKERKFLVALSKRSKGGFPLKALYEVYFGCRPSEEDFMKMKYVLGSMGHIELVKYFSVKDSQVYDVIDKNNRAH